MNLPKNWETCKLEECVDILDSKRVPINSSEREERLQSAAKTYPYYGATGQVGEIDDYLFDQEAILLGEDGAPFFELHKAKAYIAVGKYWVNNHAHILTARDGVLNKYVCHQLNILNYQRFVAGTTRLKLTQASMKTIPIKVAPTNEQRRIVSKIEELFSDLDAGEAALRKAQRLIEMYRQSVLNSAVSGNATGDTIGQIVKVNDTNIPVPTGWQCVSFENIKDKTIVGLDRGARFQSLDHKYPYFKMNNITLDGRCNFSKMTRVEATDAEVAKYSLKAGDFLFNTRNSLELVGKTGVINTLPERTVLFNNNILRVNFTKNVNAHYVCYYFQSSFGKKQLERLKSATTNVAAIYQGSLDRFMIAIPSIEKQNKIVALTESLLSSIEKINEEIDSQTKRQRALRQSILKQAFEGKLVPQNPADEPASELLKRISAQSSQPKAARGRKKKEAA
ncbi:MAG: hypothetical protein EBQ92_00280 [Proteobacteria bacterium]|nr:hypothetical protein [Pseudomonadota bacterium]